MEIKKISSQKINHNRPTTRKIIILVILGTFLTTLSLRYFILYSDVFSAGLGGMVQGITYTLWDVWGEGVFGASNSVAFDNVTFWILNITLNIPLFIFTWKYFGRNFFNYSLFAFVLGAGLGFLLSTVPVLDELSFFDSMGREAQIVIASTIGGIIYGLGSGIIYSAGACTMGTDPISKYISRRWKKSIALFTVVFSVINSMMWMIIQASINGDIHSFKTFMETIFDIRVLGTLLLLSTYAISVSYIYPSLKKFEVTVNSRKTAKFPEGLKKAKYNRTYSLWNVVGGFSKSERDVVSFLINSEELYDLLDVVHTIDNEAFVTVKKVDRIYGEFNTTDTLIDKSNE